MSGDQPVNVVVVLADQLRRQSLGAYGDANAATPHIDSLALQGARFENSCSTYPVCVPFRFSFMTGEYAHTRAVPAIQWRMSPCERTLADQFNGGGYHTAYFGKWHLYDSAGGVLRRSSTQIRRTHIPREHRGGWQHFAGFEVCNDPFETLYFVDDDPTVREMTQYQTDGLFDMALAYIKQSTQSEKGFCCVISVEPPHPPFKAPDEYMKRWRDRSLALRANVGDTSHYDLSGEKTQSSLEEDLRGYYAAIENLDDNVGRLVGTISEMGEWHRTVVILASDHGELLGSHGLRGKHDPREESIGIPLIVAGGRVKRRQVHSDPVCTEDLYPTILGLAGLEAARSKPGTDLTPLLTGKLTELDRPGIMLEMVAEYRTTAPFHHQTWRAFRTRTHKYVVLGDGMGGRPWLYFDLVNDPYEMANLAHDTGRGPELATMHKLLRERMRETGDHYVLAAAHGEHGLNEWASTVLQ